MNVDTILAYNDGMTKREKRLQKLRQKPKNVSFDELAAVLYDFGFELKRSSGSHNTFSASIEDEVYVIVVPFRRPIKSVYVKEAIKLIDKIIAAGEETHDDNQES